MKVEIISWSSDKGGAARASYRLFKALRNHQKKNLSINMRVNNCNFIEEGIINPKTNFEIGWNLLRRYLGSNFQKFQKTTNQSFHSSGLLPSLLDKKINNSDADIINLHWFQGEMLSIRAIGRIKKPIIFTLHDSWAFLGTEHYPNGYDDIRYIEGYRKNNKPLNSRGLDLDRISWQMKKKYWKSKYQIICPSNWLANCVKKSSLMNNWPIKVIPNPVPTNIFKKSPKNFSRKIFNLELNKKYILFGALKGSSEPRKGWDLLQGALKIIPNNNKKIEAIIIGENEPINPPKLRMKINYFGTLQDNQTLSLIYSAVDLVLVPSRMDNLPQTATEAVTCGTPVVAFNCSGLPDVIDHKKTGYLADPFEIKSLAKGIEWILEDDDRLLKISENCREKAMRNWDSKIIAEKYMKIYREIYENFNLI